MNKLLLVGNKVVLINETKTASFENRVVEIFENLSEQNYSQPILFFIEKLPKYWSIKNGKLTHRIGLFCFDHVKFKKELVEIILMISK